MEIILLGNFYRFINGDISIAYKRITSMGLFRKFLLLLLIQVSCNKKTDITKNLEGIWVPKKTNWPNGNFRTLCFLNDSTFAIFISNQKLIADSIYFEAEPGFKFSKGKVKKIVGDTLYITSKILYRFITMPGEATPSGIMNEKIIIKNSENNDIEINYGNIVYVKTRTYTNKSKRSIVDFTLNLEKNLP